MIVVTGSSRGLGLAICERLHSLGVDVFGLSRDVSNATFPSMSCDVSSYEEVKKVVLTLKKEDKKVSGLVNAAGIASMNHFITTPSKTSENIFDINFQGTLNFSKYSSKMMMKKK